MQIEQIAADAATESRAAFTADPKAFEAAAAFLAKRVMERRNSIPILSHIRIEATPAGAVILSGTDLDQLARVTIAADVESPGTVCVEAGPLADALAKLAKGKAGHIRFASEGQEAHFPARTIERVILTAGTGGAAFTLKTLPADDFPLTPISEAGEALPGFTVPAARFLADLAALAPCMSASEARYYLQGVSIQARDLAGRDRLLLAATDGANMALASRPIPAGAESLPDLILHRKAVAMLPHAAKIAGAADALALAYDARKFSGGMIRLDLGAVTIWTKAIDGTFPDIARPFAEQLAPTGDDAGPMFPELVAGTPLASMAKLEKAAGQPLEWQDAAQGKLGVAPGDDGLLFACMNVVAANEPVKGFTYGYDHDRERAFTYLHGLAETRNGPIPFAWQSNSLQVREGQAVGATFGQREWTKGEYVERPNWETLVVEQVYIEPREVWADGSYSVVMPREDRRPLQANVTLEIDGDATVYPLAQNRAGAIHLNAEQVRRIAGDSCFETLALTIAGRVVYVLQWLFAQGDSRFMTVRADGRCFTGKQRDQVQFLTRDQVEAALRGETVGEVIEPEATAPAIPEICQPEAAGSDLSPDMAQEGGEAPGALHGPESGPVELVSETCELPADPLADLAARVAALEARIAALPAESTGAAVNGEKIEVAPTGEAKAPIQVRAEASPAHLSEFASPSPAESEDEPCPAQDSPEPVEALCEADSPNSEHVDIIAPDHADEAPESEWVCAPNVYDAPTPVADEPAQPDIIAALVARIEALEARLAPLSGESIATPTVAKRTPAHERAIRRAWAMRAERRKLIAAYNQAGDDRRTLRKERDDLAGELQRLQSRKGELEQMANAWGLEAHQATAKRRRSTMLARDLGKRLNAEHRLVDRANERRRNASHAADEQRARADAAETALAAIQARANGWPPAVRSVNVRYRAAA